MSDQRIPIAPDAICKMVDEAAQTMATALSVDNVELTKQMILDIINNMSATASQAMRVMPDIVLDRAPALKTGALTIDDVEVIAGIKTMQLWLDAVRHASTCVLAVTQVMPDIGIVNQFIADTPTEMFREVLNFARNRGGVPVDDMTMEYLETWLTAVEHMTATIQADAAEGKPPAEDQAPVNSMEDLEQSPESRRMSQPNYVGVVIEEVDEDPDHVAP